jgi:hypothetical protein
MFWKVFRSKRKKEKNFTWLDQLRDASRAWGLRIGGWLQRKSLNLSRVQLKLYAASFVLLFASWNGWIVYQALQGRHGTIPSRQLYLFHPILPSVRLPADPFSSTGVQEFRSWLDSLQKDTAGRKIYDSIRRERPGLLDSLRQIEKSDFIHH